MPLIHGYRTCRRSSITGIRTGDRSAALSKWHGHPIEAKKSASPGKTAIKNFSVLEPLAEPDRFGGMQELKVEIGTGNVICMARDLLPADEKNWYVPVWLIQAKSSPF